MLSFPHSELLCTQGLTVWTKLTLVLQPDVQLETVAVRGVLVNGKFNKSTNVIHTDKIIKAGEFKNHHLMYKMLVSLVTERVEQHVCGPTGLGIH